MQKTQNYNLNKPEAIDPVRVADFNENVEIIDAALNSLSAALAGKAEQSAVNEKGNCRIAVGTYTGNGTYGATNPVMLTFDFVPKMVVVAEMASIFYPMIILDGVTRIKMANGYSYVVRSGTSVGWYNENSAENQFNYSGTVYCYITLG